MAAVIMRGSVVIAARGGDNAKSRCAGMLPGNDRATLTKTMLVDMLTQLQPLEPNIQIMVVTPTHELAAIAAAHHVRVVPEISGRGLNAAFRTALTLSPPGPVALLPGDLPCIDRNELTLAFRLTRGHDVVLARAKDGGTGALITRWPSFAVPEFGPDSSDRHRASAVALGRSVTVIDLPSLACDIDIPADFSILSRRSDLRTAQFLRTSTVMEIAA